MTKIKINIPEMDFHIFVRGGWINIWGGGAAACFGQGVVATPERPRKRFNKICFPGLHG
jgi:hypothetical protein